MISNYQTNVVESAYKVLMRWRGEITTYTEYRGLTSTKINTRSMVMRLEEGALGWSTLPSLGVVFSCILLSLVAW